MRVHKAEFIKSAQEADQYPKYTVPEVVFAGRSNVGKSSLINKLTGRNGLVKVSKTPGKTRLLNFFNINDVYTFVDIPGYGFANVPGNVQKSWGAMVESYLGDTGRKKITLALLDCRRKPNDDDLSLFEWLYHHKIVTIPVFTKIDKIPKTRRATEIKKVWNSIGEVMETEGKPLIFSSLSGEGKKELWAAIRDSFTP